MRSTLRATATTCNGRRFAPPLMLSVMRSNMELHNRKGHMINYIMLGTNSLETSVEFYDSLLVGAGASRAYKTDSMAAWSFGEGTTMLSVTKPFNEELATVGNGVMVALSVENPAAVDSLHAKALELGATNEGSPGLRGKAFYAGYFRDLDGNKLNFFCYQ